MVEEFVAFLCFFQEKKNFKKFSDTFKNVLNVNVGFNTIKKYCEYFEDDFLVNQAKRYNIQSAYSI